MRIAAYIRVSTGRQAEEGMSLAGQLDQIKAFAECNRHQIVEVYEEAGASATDDRRPQFQRMIADAVLPAHPFDAVVVFSLSRFFRDNHGFLSYVKLLKRVKVKLISVTQPTSDDEAGEMVSGILATFDEYQSRENGKNVRRSMIANAQQGFYNGSTPPFGYVAAPTDVKGRNGYKRKLELHPNEAQIVRSIFEWASAGDGSGPWGAKRIATELNRRGLLRRGKRWRQQAVWNLLTSSTYYGDYVFNRRDSRADAERDKGEWVTTKIPPIVSKEDFARAAALRSDRAPGKSGGGYRAQASATLLAGLAHCAHCGAGLVLMSGKGGHYDYYRCSTRQYKGSGLCDCPNIPREELEAIVLKTVAEKVLQPDRIRAMLDLLRDRITKAQAPDRERELLLQRQRAVATEQINLWCQLVEERKLTLGEAVQERLRAAQARIDDATQQLAEIASRRQLPLRKFGDAQVESFASGVRTEVLSPGSKLAKGYLRAIVSDITVGAVGGCVTGGLADIAGAVSTWNADDATFAVPRHLSSWRLVHDSNVRPPAS
jgi:site-specific DNA recombinase